MARSAADATRFTSTGPSAAYKAPSPSHPANMNGATPRLPPRNPGPPGETPQEKVKRLRAAAQKAKEEKVSTFDNLVTKGRRWADRAHRFTALSLIGFTGVATVVTVYSLVDMMLYNRRKRTQYFIEQKAMLAAAQAAFREGTASEAQMEILRKEAAIDAAVREAKAKRGEKDYAPDPWTGEKKEVEPVPEKKEGVLKKSREWLFSGLKKEESPDARVRAVWEEEKEEAKESGSGILKAVEEKRKEFVEEEKERQMAGGMLDKLAFETEASNQAETKAEKGKSWWSSLTGR